MSPFPFDKLRENGALIPASVRARRRVAGRTSTSGRRLSAVTKCHVVRGDSLRKASSLCCSRRTALPRQTAVLFSYSSLPKRAIVCVWIAGMLMFESDCQAAGILLKDTVQSGLPYVIEGTLADLFGQREGQRSAATPRATRLGLSLDCWLWVRDGWSSGLADRQRGGRSVERHGPRHFSGSASGGPAASPGREA